MTAAPNRRRLNDFRSLQRMILSPYFTWRLSTPVRYACPACLPACPACVRACVCAYDALCAINPTLFIDNHARPRSTYKISVLIDTYTFIALHCIVLYCIYLNSTVFFKEFDCSFQRILRKRVHGSKFDCGCTRFVVQLPGGPAKRARTDTSQSSTMILIDCM